MDVDAETEASGTVVAAPAVAVPPPSADAKDAPSSMDVDAKTEASGTIVVAAPVAAAPDDANKPAPPKKKARKAKSTDPNAPKKAKSGYDFFASDKRAEIVAALPSDATVTFGDTSKAVGAAWAELDEAGKAPYATKVRVHPLPPLCPARTDRLPTRQATLDKERYESEKAVYVSSGAAAAAAAAIASAETAPKKKPKKVRLAPPPPPTPLTRPRRTPTPRRKPSPRTPSSAPSSAPPSRRLCPRTAGRCRR